MKYKILKICYIPLNLRQFSLSIPVMGIVDLNRMHTGGLLARCVDSRHGNRGFKFLSRV